MKAQAKGACKAKSLCRDRVCDAQAAHSRCVANAFATHRRQSRCVAIVFATHRRQSRCESDAFATQERCVATAVATQERCVATAVATQINLASTEINATQRKPTQRNGNQSSAGNFGECLDRSSQHRSVRIYKTIYLEHAVCDAQAAHSRYVASAFATHWRQSRCVVTAFATHGRQSRCDSNACVTQERCVATAVAQQEPCVATTLGTQTLKAGIENEQKSIEISKDQWSFLK